MGGGCGVCPEQHFKLNYSIIHLAQRERREVPAPWACTPDPSLFSCRLFLVVVVVALFSAAKQLEIRLTSDANLSCVVKSIE